MKKGFIKLQRRKGKEFKQDLLESIKKVDPCEIICNLKLVMAKKYLHFLFTIILFLALKTGFCSHVPGGNITYECLGNNRYVVSLILFENSLFRF